VDFSGWQFPKGHEGHWVSKDWTIVYDGRSAAPEKDLWTDRSYGNVSLIADWRWMDDAMHALPAIPLRFEGVKLPDEALNTLAKALVSGKPKGQWRRALVTKRGGRLTVLLDGQTVLQDVPVPSLQRRGRIALRHDGRVVEFANIFVKE
jgi:hypothetical protein